MKKISDDVKLEICKARESGKTLSELVDQFGYSKSSVYNIIKDCDSSLVERASPSRRVVDKVESCRPNLSKTDIGEAARQMICARLMLNGANVFRPMTEDTPIDLLVLVGDKALKCQCKYMYLQGRSGKHVMNLYATRKNAGKEAARRPYTKEEVDFFLGYCLDNDSVYVIPFEAAEGRQSLGFWIAREKKGTNGKECFKPSDYLERYDFLTLEKK